MTEFFILVAAIGLGLTFSWVAMYFLLKVMK